jgi:hypothetical protein
MIYPIVQGDSAPQLEVTLTRDDDGSAVDLTQMLEGKLRFRAKGSKTILSTLTGFNPFGTKAQGLVYFAFGQPDLASLPAGYYEGEIEIVYTYGKKETCYEVINFHLREDFDA